MTSVAEAEWIDAELFCPFQHEQALLYEHAECVATRAFLKMANLPFSIEQRPNAEFISPTGTVPLLKLQNTLIAGFADIIDFVSQKGVKLTSTLSDNEMADMNAMISQITETLVLSEMYVCWMDNATYSCVTSHRYGSVYFFPLRYILPFIKRRERLSYLDNVGWSKFTLDDVEKKCDTCFQTLSIRLGTKKFMMGDEPTELDALAFGHLFTLLTTELPVMRIANRLRNYPNLIKYCCTIDEEYFKR